MKIFHLMFLLKQVSGTLYRQVEHITARHENTIYEEEEVPSNIACVHKCFRLQADAIYIDMVCKCTRMDMAESLPNEGPLATRQYSISNRIKSQHDITAESKWKRIIIIEKETAITNNTLVTTIPKVTKEYVLNVDVKPMVFDAIDSRNVIHFTTSEGTNQYGSRTPAIYFNHKKPGGLSISSAVRGPAVVGSANKSYGYKKNLDETYAVGEWIRIKISQILKESEYTFSVHINDKLVDSVKNDQPESFSDVKVYVSNPWASPQAGFVTNVWIDVLK